MAASINNTAISPAVLELVDQEIHRYVEQDHSAYSMFTDGEAEQINPRGAYIPGEAFPNASFGGGYEGFTYPQWGGQVLQRMVVAYLWFAMSTQLTRDSLQVTAGIISPTLARNLASDTEQMLTQHDYMLFNNGSGERGVVLSVATPTVTFAGPFYSYRVLKNGYYVFINPGTGLQRTGNYKVASKTGTTATFTSALDGSIAPGDIMVHDNGQSLGMYNLELAGLPFHVTSSTTGTYQGILRTNLPSTFRASDLDCASAAWSVNLIQTLISQLKFKPGDAAMPDHFFLTGPTQEKAFLDLGQVLGPNNSSLKRATMSDGNFDPQFKTITYAGHTFKISKHCPADTAYYLWRGFLKNYKFLEIGLERNGSDGSGLFPVPATGSSGFINWTDNAEYLMRGKSNLGSLNPAQTARWYNLNYTGLPVPNQ